MCECDTNSILKESLDTAYQKGYKKGIDKGRNQEVVFIVFRLIYGHASVSAVWKTKEEAVAHIGKLEKEKLPIIFRWGKFLVGDECGNMYEGDG